MLYTVALKEAYKDAKISLNTVKWIGDNLFGGRFYRKSLKHFDRLVKKPIIKRYGRRSKAALRATQLSNGLKYMAKNPIKATTALSIGSTALGAYALSKPSFKKYIAKRKTPTSKALAWSIKHPVLSGAGSMGAVYGLGLGL